VGFSGKIFTNVGSKFRVRGSNLARVPINERGVRSCLGGKSVEQRSRVLPIEERKRGQQDKGRKGENSKARPGGGEKRPSTHCCDRTQQHGSLTEPYRTLSYASQTGKVKQSRGMKPRTSDWGADRAREEKKACQQQLGGGGVLKSQRAWKTG